MMWGDGLLFCHGLPSLGLSSSDVSNDFPQKGKNSPTGKNSLGCQVSIDLGRNQNLVADGSQNQSKKQRVRITEWTRPPRVTEGIDVKIYMLLWISQAWSTLVRKFLSHRVFVFTYLIIIV